jgi:hypothetical protein
MACCHLVLALHNTKQHQIRPFQRVVWEEWQRLTCEPAVHDEGVPGSQGTQANSAQAGDRLLLRVEVLVACSFTPKKALHLRHTAGTSGSSGSRSMLVPSNICSINGIAPVVTYLKFSTFQSLVVVSQRPQIHVDLNRLIERRA